MACQPYSEAVKPLEQEFLGICIKGKQYYNLTRNKPFNKTDSAAAVILLQALQDEGFKYRTFTEDRYNDKNPNTITSRRLIQIKF